MKTEKISQNINYITKDESPYKSVLMPEDTPFLKSGKIEDNKITNLNIVNILKEEYTQIYQSVLENNYKISRDETCFYFYAVPDENDETIGFLTFNMESEEILSITHVYIMPDARGNNTFLRLLEFFSNLVEGLIVIKNPNYALVEILSKTELCTTIANRFIISSVPFIFNIVSWNESINDVYEYNNLIDETNPKIAMTTVYDKKLYAPILVNRSSKILEDLDEFRNEEYCLMAMTRYDDNQEYNSLCLRQSDKWIKSGKYFKKILKLLNKSKLWI
ncbi:MAG: hypothetical protein E7Z86_09360 [Methanosphaera stadtmanae]|nr:hypothetical protein [Methanosphaera stadtmanae]